MMRLAFLLCFGLSACSALLPRGESAIEGPWPSFADAQRAFDQIVPYRTRVADLEALRLDPQTSPNITLLNYSDVLRRFLPGPTIDAENLDAGVKECIAAKTACRGLEIDQRSIRRRRLGNFWVDFLNFKRHVDVTGWRFNGVLLIKDEVVVYKLMGGQPVIHETEESRNPLGPLQSLGESQLRSRIAP